MKISGERVFFDQFSVESVNDGYLPSGAFVYNLTALLIVDGLEVEVKRANLTKTQCDAILERIYPVFRVVCTEIDFG